MVYFFVWVCVCLWKETFFSQSMKRPSRFRPSFWCFKFSRPCHFFFSWPPHTHTSAKNTLLYRYFNISNFISNLLNDLVTSRQKVQNIFACLGEGVTESWVFFFFFNLWGGCGQPRAIINCNRGLSKTKFRWLQIHSIERRKRNIYIYTHKWMTQLSFY